MNAWTVPGNINSSPRSVRVGSTVTTVGKASIALSLASELRATTRSNSPQAASATATANKASRYEFILRERSDMRALRCVCRVRGLSSMNDRKQSRHKKQGCDRRKNEAADDRTPEGSVLLAALPEAQRHWNHSDDHCSRGHHDRPYTCESGLQSCLECTVARIHPFAREADHEHAVGGRHPHTHDRAHERRYADGGMGEEQHPDDAREGGGER